MLLPVEERAKIRLGDYYDYAPQAERERMIKLIEEEDRIRTNGKKEAVPVKQAHRGRPRKLRPGKVVALFLEDDIIRCLEDKAKREGVTFSAAVRDVLQVGLK